MPRLYFANFQTIPMGWMMGGGGMMGLGMGWWTGPGFAGGGFSRCRWLHATKLRVIKRLQNVDINKSNDSVYLMVIHPSIVR